MPAMAATPVRRRGTRSKAEGDDRPHPHDGGREECETESPLQPTDVRSRKDHRDLYQLRVTKKSPFLLR
jgi:hypothetical protein